jgi:hypothetical protein
MFELFRGRVSDEEEGRHISTNVVINLLEDMESFIHQYFVIRGCEHHSLTGAGLRMVVEAYSLPPVLRSDV